jgi:hypothetical protein
MPRRSSRSNARGHRSGFGSSEHVQVYATRFYVSALVYSHGEQKPRDVQQTLLNESRGHLQGVAYFRGVHHLRIKLLTYAVEEAIDMALKDYKTAELQWSAAQLGWLRAMVQYDMFVDATWGAEEHAVVRRFLKSVPETDIDRGTLTIFALRYLEDPRDYDAAIAVGLSEADYIRLAVPRLREEARILRSGGHRIREVIAKIKKDWPCAPAALKEYSLHSDVQQATLPSRVSESAMARFEHLRLWVPDDTDGDEDVKIDQVAHDAELVGLATATQEFCDWKRMQFEGREDNAAKGHELMSDVNVPAPLDQESTKVFLRGLTRASILNNHWSPGPGFAGTNSGRPTSKITAMKRRRPRG